MLKKSLCVYFCDLKNTLPMHACTRACVSACVYVCRENVVRMCVGVSVRFKSQMYFFLFYVFVTAFRESFTNQFFEMIKLQMSTCIVIFFVKNVCNNRSNFVFYCTLPAQLRLFCQHSILHRSCFVNILFCIRRVLSTFYSACIVF